MEKYESVGLFRLMQTVIIIPLIFATAGLAAEISSDSLYSEALGALAVHDTARALERLDRCLERDRENHRAFLTRAGLRLERGDTKEARADFDRALYSGSPVLRSEAHLGLAEILRRSATGKTKAVKEIRLAIQVDPTNLEARYRLAALGFELGEAKGYEIAEDALTDILCLEPGYRDAFRLWREEIKGKSAENRRKLASTLPEHIGRDPALAPLWLEVARQWFDLFETDRCMAALDSLESHAPVYKPQERRLLRARCLLDRKDTDGFMRNYFEALYAASRTGDFDRIALEAEVIFTPEEEKAFAGTKSARGMAAFFRVFWLNKDPDPVTFVNERLVEHYNRLRRAQKQYPLLSADGLAQSSENYLRLMSRTAEELEGSTAEHLYEYDPVKVFGHRGESLGLDHRGLLYVRHGPPDFVERIFIRDRRDGLVETLGDLVPNTEGWVFWPDTFFFKSGLGTGGYLYYPKQSRGVGNIAKAMQTQSMKDPLKVRTQDHYRAVFLAADGSLEMECYQGSPLSESKQKDPPPAWMILYDRSILELARDSVQAVRAGYPDGEAWLAVNRLPVTARDYSCVLSLGFDKVRAVVKQNLRVDPLSAGRLSLSGVVLGSPVKEGREPHSRLGVPLLPRPSRRYSPEDIITVYCEVYGLARAADGSRGYRQAVTVSLEEERKSALKAVLRRGDKRRGSLTMSFERQAAAGEGRIPESFRLDTSELLPGRYSLTIRVQDLNGGFKAETVSGFTVE